MENDEAIGARVPSRRPGSIATGATTLHAAGATKVSAAGATTLHAAGAARVSAAGATTVVDHVPVTGAPGRRSACALTPEWAGRPLEVVRKDITDGRSGVPLALRVRVVDPVGRPVDGAVLELWHCNALGVYSGPMPPAAGAAADDDRFLRGAQVTGDGGYAEFSSIFPGWYAGRAVHVHAAAHMDGAVRTAGGHVAHAGQFFFAEDLTRAVTQLAPYRSNRTARTTNGQDRYFTAGGAAGMLTVVPRDRYHLGRGLLGTITVAVDPAATPAPM